MTSTGIEKQHECAAVPPLPRLKVVRDTWCSQQLADNAADFLQAHKPDLIQELAAEERGERLSEYFNVVYEILDALNEAGQALPATMLGKVDLACELSRRVRNAYGYAELKPKGHPLASGPDQPLPPMVNVPIDEGTARRGNLTQDAVDKILAQTYQRRPDLWYALAEEYRHQMRLFAVDEFQQLLADVAGAEFGDKRNNWAEGELYLEAVRRLHRMCGIDGGGA